MSNKYGVLAEFDSPKTLLKAAKEVRGKGYKKFETYSPFPIHGMDDAMGLKPTIIGWIVLVGGILGLSTGLGLQTWASTAAYRLVISGKPFFSYQAFVPVTFELMVLFSAFAAVFGMFFLNGLPKWYHALFKDDDFKRASSHGFFLSIESKDNEYNSKTVQEFLISIGGRNVKEIVK